MERETLNDYALRNREVFDLALPIYVEQKLTQALGEFDKTDGCIWLDATACVWCLFDDERFVRSGNLASEIKARDASFGLCVFWSFGDVCMPSGCDRDWVAKCIVHEGKRQLRALGLHAMSKTRTVERERHKGLFASRRLTDLVTALARSS